LVVGDYKNNYSEVYFSYNGELSDQFFQAEDLCLPLGVSDISDESESETCFVNISNQDVDNLIDFGEQIGVLDKEVYTSDVRSKIESGDTDISALVRLILDSGAGISSTSDPNRIIQVSQVTR
jgi:hypothetical protein